MPLKLFGEFLFMPSISPEPSDPFMWCGSIPAMAPRGPSEPGPMGKLFRLPGPVLIMVYKLSPELLESAGLGMMGVPGGPPPPDAPPYAPGEGDE